MHAMWMNVSEHSGEPAPWIYLIIFTGPSWSSGYRFKIV